MSNELRIDGWSDAPDSRLITYQVLDEEGQSQAVGTVEVKLDASALAVRRACLKDARKWFKDVEMHPESEFGDK